MSHMSGCCAPHRRTLRHPNHLASRTLDTAHSVTVSQQLPGHPTDRKLDGSSGVALDVSGCFWIISMLFNAALSIAEPWLLSNSGHFQEELAQAWHKHGTSSRTLLTQLGPHLGCHICLARQSKAVNGLLPMKHGSCGTTRSTAIANASRALIP